MSKERNELIWREGCVAALAALPDMGPGRLKALLDDTPPEIVWDRLAGSFRPNNEQMRAMGSRHADLLKNWRKVVRATDPIDVIERHQRAGIQIWSQYNEFPARLQSDMHAPSVLFAQGNRGALDYPTVALIGTRRCTQEGRNIARRFGVELAEAGVAVVSGLALGIDGSAHQGSLEALYGAPPIAVVGSGLDRVYPKQNATLWQDVRERGLLISEAPLGALPKPWRFPARNRIIAGLADVVVVIESHERGGSLITVDEAIERGRSVMAVPGSVQKPASIGSNRLLADSIPPACSTEDILRELTWCNQQNQVSISSPQPSQPPLLGGSDAVVLESIDWVPTSTDDIILRCGLTAPEVAACLARLETFGCIYKEAGYWLRQSVDWAS